MASEPEASNDKQSHFDFEIQKHAHERWWHEDELVNQRTTWLLTTQGVLGTAYGFVRYRIAEVKYRSLELPQNSDSSLYVDTLSMFSKFLATIGVGSSLMSLLGIFAACLAQNALRQQCGSYLGVTERTTMIGQFVAISTPVLCICAWIVACVYFWASGLSCVQHVYGVDGKAQYSQSTNSARSAADIARRTVVPAIMTGQTPCLRPETIPPR